MKQLRAILVDDELSSLQNLQRKLIEFCPDVDLVAIAQKPEEAILLIRQHNPDVIFLDIEMPRMNGFRMLDEMGEYNFDIVFTTAYNHYAIDAIRISAFDYLTKPIAIKDLQNTVERLVRHRSSNTKDRMESLKASMQPVRSQEEKIAIPTSEGLEFIPIKNIVHIESSSNYSRLFFIDGKNVLVTKILGDFEEMLKAYNFYRVHNSHLINLVYIKKYVRGEGGHVVMQNGVSIDVARRKKEEFLKIING
ncbi:MAG: LytTR family DNA-binding domain-containing protein [Ginsengibacter sp.]